MHGGDPVKIGMVGSKAAQAPSYGIYTWGTNQYGSLGIDSLTYLLKYPTPLVSPQSWSMLAAGESHVHGISGGRLWSWGLHINGRLGNGNAFTTVAHPGTTVGNSANWTWVDAGSENGAGICGGECYCWGNKLYGRLGNGETGSGFYSTPQRVGTSSNWTRVMFGVHYAIGICGGQLWAWGRNHLGQLGQGNTLEYQFPTQVGGATGWTEIWAGEAHAFGICGGQLWAWGDNNSFGQLGVGNSNPRYSPTGVCGGFTDWVAISGRKFSTTSSSFGIRGSTVDGGTLMAWGYNAGGDLGLGNTTSRTSPVAVSGNKWKYATCNNLGAASIGISGDELWSWADPLYGYRVIKDRDTGDSNVPVLTPNGTGWNYLSHGGGLAIHFRQGNTMYAAGDSRNYVIANTTNVPSSRSSPGLAVEIANDTNFKFPDIGFGNEVFTSSPQFIVFRDGLTAWGFGQGETVNGGGTTSLFYSQEYPISLHARNYSFISIGNSHAHGICGGQLWAWGSGANGRLGVGNTTNYYRNNPQRVGGSSSWTAVAGGVNHSLGICGGQLWAWGSPANGCLGNGLTTGTYNSPILVSGATGWTWVCAGRNTSHGICGGQLWGWGTNSTTGKVGNGSGSGDVLAITLISGGTGWTKVFANSYSTYGICGGNLYAWGNNTSGALGIGSGSGSTFAPALVSASGNWTTLAPRANGCMGICGGQLWSWGRNASGEVGDGTGTDRSSPVRIGSDNNWEGVLGGDGSSFGLKKL